ncbi:NADH-quinone oxidoreductase subunit M, partial [Kitasatospora sp. NPDC002227]
MNAVLIALLLVPLAGAALTLAPLGSDRRALRFGAGVTGLVLLLSIVLAAGFDHDRPSRMQ